MLMTLQQSMIKALEEWITFKAISINLTLLFNKRQTINAEISYYKECLRAFDVSVEVKEKNVWKSRVSKSNPIENNVHIIEARKGVEVWAKEQRDELKRQKSKILSSLRFAQNNLVRLNNEMSLARVGRRDVLMVLGAARKELSNEYRSIMSEWGFIQDHLDKTFGTLNDVRAEQTVLKESKKELYEVIDEADSNFETYRERIARARRNDDYGTFDRDKTRKNRYFEERSDGYKKLNKVKNDLAELDTKYKKIKTFKEHLYAISPQIVIENFFKHLSQHMPTEAPEAYFDSVRIKTKATYSIIDDGYARLSANKKEMHV
jgi:chromosome segregation ATPase